MAGSIAKAYVQIIPSAEGIKGKLSNVFNGEMPSAGQNAGGIFGSNLVGKIKGLIVTAGIGKAFTDAIMGGSDLQQLKGGVQKIFDEMDTATIMADAANAYSDLNMSANQYLATINDVGATFSATMGDEKGYSVARTGLQAISDYATGTGKNVDILSEKFTMITRSTSSYQSIADQFSGILPATSAGFLEQAQAAGFLSDQYKSLTEVPIDEYQQAVAEMLAKGTAELGLAGNTAAETATTFAGALAAMKSAYSNFLGALATGEDIGPSLEVLGETVFTFISGNLMPMVGNILAELPTVLSSAFGMAIQGLNIAADNADALLQQGIDLVIGIGTSIITALPYLAEAALNIVAAIGNAVISTDWLQIGQDTINGLRSSLDLAAAEILGTDGNIVQSVLDSIAANLPAVLDGGVDLILELVDGLWKAAPTALTTIGELLVQLLAAIMDTLPSIFESGFELIAGLAEGMLENLPSIISAGMDIIADLLTEFASHLPELLEQGITLTGEFAAGLIEAIPEVVSAADDIVRDAAEAFSEFDWVQLGKDIVNGLIKGLGAMESALWTAAKNVAQTALDSIKDFLGIASPSKVMRDQVGKFIPAGIAVGITANTGELRSAMDDLSDMTVDSMKASLKISDACTAAAAPVKSYGNFSLTVHVHGAEGQSVDKLADAVMQKIQSAVNSEEVVFA